MHIAVAIWDTSYVSISLIFFSKNGSPNPIPNPTPCEQTLTSGQRMLPNVGAANAP